MVSLVSSVGVMAVALVSLFGVIGDLVFLPTEESEFEGVVSEVLRPRGLLSDQDVPVRILVDVDKVYEGGTLKQQAVVVEGAIDDCPTVQAGARVLVRTSRSAVDVGLNATELFATCGSIEAVAESAPGLVGNEPWPGSSTVGTIPWNPRRIPFVFAVVVGPFLALGVIGLVVKFALRDDV